MKVFMIKKDDKIRGVFDAVAPLITFVYQYAEEFGFDDCGKNFNDMSVTDIEKELNRYMAEARLVSYELNTDYYDAENEFRYGNDIYINAKADQHYIWTAQMLDGTNFTVTAPYKPLAIEEAVMQHINETGIYSGVEVIKRQ